MKTFYIFLVVFLFFFSCPQTSSSNDVSNSNFTISISGNHGHVLNITMDDVNAGIKKIYDIKGTSNHPHTIDLTAINFDDLKNGKQISVTSSTDSDHDHTVTISLTAKN